MYKTSGCVYILSEDEAGVFKYKKEFADKLLEWWNSNKRDFPWRRTKDPYKVLVAEILLRKTTSWQVLNIYESLLKKYPDIAALARGSVEDLRNLLRPLGMEHKRSSLLLRLANKIKNEHGGVVPATMNELLKLPGVGRYTASGVLCLAYGKNEPMVDTNAIRVVQRVFGYKSTRARAKDDPELWNFVRMLIPQNKAKDFNLAIIDFAHQVCLPKRPKCEVCILNMICKYAQKGKRLES